MRNSADLSPNNRGFAMADWTACLNVRVSGAHEMGRIAIKAVAGRQL